MKSMKKTVVATIFSTAMILSGCGVFESSDKDHIENAKEYIDKGNVQGGIIELKNALQKNPENAEARWMLGKIYVKASLGAPAEKELKRSEQLGIPRSATIVYLSKAYFLQHKYQELVKDTADMQGLDDSIKAELHGMRAEAFLFLNERSKAEMSLEQAEKYDAQSPGYLVARARHLAVKKELEKAREVVLGATVIDPEYSRAWLLLGDIDRARGDMPNAEIAYTNALKHSISNIEALYYRAVLRLNTGKTKGAQKDIKALAKVAPRNPRTFFAQGMLFYVNKQYPNAQHSFEKSHKLWPEHLPTKYYLGASHFAQGHGEQAEYFLVQVVTQQPDFIQARKMLGGLYLGLRKYSEAVEILEPASRISAQDASILALLGEAHIKSGHIEEGVEVLKKAVEIKPDLTQGKVMLALGLMSTGKTEEGKAIFEDSMEVDLSGQTDIVYILKMLESKDYKKARETATRLKVKTPEKPMADIFLGIISNYEGNARQAREHFNTALKILPSEPTALHNLAVLDISDKNIDAARERYELALKHNPEHLETIVRYSEFLLLHGPVEKAVSLLSNATTKYPRAVKPKVVLGKYYLSQGQPLKVLALIGQDEAKTSPDLSLVQGQAYLASNQARNAISVFSGVVNKQPDNMFARYLAAKAYYQNKENSKAKELLEYGLKKEPENILLNTMAIVVDATASDSDNVLDQTRRLLEKHPEHPDVMALHAWGLLKAGKYSEAITVYEKTYKIFKTRELLKELTDILWNQGRRNESISYLEKWASNNPDDYLISYLLAEKLAATGLTDRAIKLLKKLVKQEPNDIIVLNNLAWLLKDSSRTEALEYARRANTNSPKSLAIKNTLGILETMTGNYAVARRLLEESSGKGSANPQTRYYLALSLHKTGANDEAKKLLKDLLSGKEDFNERNKAEILYNSIK